jgi:SAM-dependent methyltransferase
MKNVWTDEVVNSLESNAFYNQGKPLFRASDKYIIEILREETEKGSAILDFACGTGRLLHLLMQECVLADYSGYDSSEAMIDKAHDKFPDDFFTNDFPNKVFDVVVNIDMLQHSEDLEVFKEKIKKVLTTGKKAIFHFWYKPDDFYQEISVNGVTFPEIFPSPATIINDISEVFEKSKYKIKLFPNEQPYKTCVIVVSQDVVSVADVEKTEVQVTEKTEKKTKKK